MSDQKFGGQPFGGRRFEDQQRFEAHEPDVLQDPLRFEVLGPVRAFRGPEELALGPVRQRAVLAVLLLRAGMTCSAAEIIAAVWGHRPPRTSVGLVRTYVSRLRRVLGPKAITSDAAGYLMRVAPEELDVTALEQQLDGARQADRTAGRARTAYALRDVLSRWTAPALDEIPGPFAHAQRARFAKL
jgi:DNA-binding SARP family transcriptional activator